MESVPSVPEFHVHNKPLRSVDPLGQDGYSCDGSSCDASLSNSDDGSSENSGDDGFIGGFEDLFDDIGSFFSSLFGGGGGSRHSSQPSVPARNYTQSSVSSNAGNSIQGRLNYSAPANNDPGPPSPANNDDCGPGSSCYALAVFSQPSLQTAAATMTDPRTYVAWAGASAVVGGTGVAAANALSAESAPLIYNSSKVLAQTQDYHAFGELIGRQAMEYGNVAIRNGSYIQWNIPGTFNGVAGFFQYGGTIGATGSPIFGSVLYVTHTFFGKLIP